MPDNRFPESRELVLCTVREIRGTTVFAELDKYHKIGVINTSEVAPGRIRNIRDYVVPNKKIVCVVLRVDTSKEHIDLSLRRVSKKDTQEELQKYKREQEAFVILKITLQEKANDVAEKILGKNPLLYPFLETSKENPKVLEEFMSKDEASKISKIVSEKMKAKKVIVKANLRITSNDPRGIEIIKKALDIKDARIIYLGAPCYMLSVEDADYKSANKRVEAIIAKISDSLRKSGSKIEFEIEKER